MGISQSLKEMEFKYPDISRGVLCNLITYRPKGYEELLKLKLAEVEEYGRNNNDYTPSELVQMALRNTRTPLKKLCVDANKRTSLLNEEFGEDISIPKSLLRWVAINIPNNGRRVILNCLAQFPELKKRHPEIADSQLMFNLICNVDNVRALDLSPED